MKNIKILQYKALPYSALGLSEEGHEELRNSDITWGTNDATLITLNTLLNGNRNSGQLNWNATDRATIETLIERCGGGMYVDLEK